MKKSVVIIGIFTLMLLAAAMPSAAAPTQVQTTGNGGDAGNGYGPYQAGRGGEFTLAVVSDPSGVLNNLYGGYVEGKTKNVPADNWTRGITFETFCLEGTEYIYPSTKFDVLVSNKAVQGGMGAGGSDPISKGTAWLYAQFATGQLTGYTYSGTVGARKVSADLLQKTIWSLEGEEGIAWNTGSNIFMKAVNDKFGSLDKANDDAAYGENGVYVLNMYEQGHAGSASYLRQDQLFHVPEPVSLLFLGIGLVGVAGIARRMKK